MVTTTKLSGPFTVCVEMVSPSKHKETIQVTTLREAAKMVRAWVMGGNPEKDFIGVSQIGKNFGRVIQIATGVEVARISYNGRVWEPGNSSTVAIVDID